MDTPTAEPNFEFWRRSKVRNLFLKNRTEKNRNNYVNPFMHYVEKMTDIKNKNTHRQTYPQNLLRKTLIFLEILFLKIRITVLPILFLQTP